MLEDFISRSTALLKKDGKVFLVAVNTLADFFRSGITAAGAALLTEKTGKEHTVFVYSAGFLASHKTTHGQDEPVVLDENFPNSYPFYIRNRGGYKMEGVSYHLDTIHGAPDFDSPGGAVQAAAKLAVKINLIFNLTEELTAGVKKSDVLIHGEGQGHFALWLFAALDALMREAHLTLSGRNILALATARAALVSARSNLATAQAAMSAAQHKPAVSNPGLSPSIVPAADMFLDRERLAASLAGAGGFSLIAFFPETIPETDRREADWEALSLLAAADGIVIAGMTSAEAERFDKKKPKAFIRLGDIKRNGFRALAYQKR